MLIKNENFIIIQGWMITDLHLSGNELLIYAAIFGFSQDGKSDFEGSRQYLAEWCNASISTVGRCLKSLIDKGLIEQVYHSVDNQTVMYKAYIDPRVKMTLASGQNDPSLRSKCHKPRVKMTRAIKDNIEDNIADNIADNIEGDIVVCETTSSTRSRFQKPTFEEVKEYIKTTGTTDVDPERFYSYYEANGWKVGRNSMKDWKAAVRMWSSREKKEQKKSGKDVPYMENSYSADHLKKREVDSARLLDDLLKD